MRLLSSTTQPSFMSDLDAQIPTAFGMELLNSHSFFVLFLQFVIFPVSIRFVDQFELNDN